MNIRVYPFLMIGFILVFGVNVQAQKTDRQIESVLQTLKKYDDAWNKKDAKTVGEILATEYVYFTSLGGLSNRQETLDFLGSPKYILTFVERSEIKTFRNGKTVVVSSRWKGKGSYNDEEINDDQRCGQVFVREDKRWKLLSEHCVQIVSK
jgi:ketosteroid isomerase-like protein